LDCPVPLILGMEFLTKVKPVIDFEKKTVTVVHCSVPYTLPTCIIGKNGDVSEVAKQQCDKSSRPDDLSKCINDQSYKKDRSLEHVKPK
jgi:hypothetical protein